MSTKNKLETSKLAPWRESVSTMVREKIKEHKQKVYPTKTKPVLYDPVVVSYLVALHRCFVVSIYKPAHNFAFTCNITSLSS